MSAKMSVFLDGGYRVTKVGVSPADVGATWVTFSTEQVIRADA